MSKVADPLREYAHVIEKVLLPSYTYVYLDGTLRERLLEVADEIDQEHERRMAQA